MATKIIMPKLGFDMSSGKVVRWLKREGDAVAKGENLLEIETDKATVEVQAEADGLLGKILVAEGDVPVGDAIGEIVGAGEKAPAGTTPATKPVAEPVAAPKNETPVPEASAKPVAAPVAAPTNETPTVEAAAKPASATGAAPANETPTAEASAKPAVASVAAPAKETPPVPSAERSAKILAAEPGHVEASPLAKRMASELGIDLGAVKGSGPGGRITREDIEAYQATQAAPQKPVVKAEPVKAAAAAAQPASGDRPLSRMRQAIARRMVESKAPIPQFHLTTDVDMAAGMAIVNQMLEAGKAEDLRPSPLSLVMKACGLMLRKYPNLNASFGGDKMLYHDFVNISVAVAVEGGLLTPVVADCDRKSVAQIARDTRAAAERARASKLNASDLAPGTFSISNLGMFEIEHFIAIVNPPEAAIMALGTAKEVPVVEGGQIKSGLRMKMTLTADHRVTDGAEAARFLQEVKRLLQVPMSLFL